MSFKEVNINPATATSNTASHQHQQEQEMLATFAIPNPPVSTQQSGQIAHDNDDKKPNDSESGITNESSGQGDEGNSPSTDNSSSNINNSNINNQSNLGSGGGGGGGGDDDDETPRTLWMGDLDPWLDEGSIENLWFQILNKSVSVKVIRPKLSKPDVNLNGLSHSGYCFVEFD